MHTVRDLPSGLVLPPIEGRIDGRPDLWSGMSVEWLHAAEPVLVFVATFQWPVDGAEADLYLFGARYDIADGLFDGESLGTGHFVEYFLVEPVAGAGPPRRLLQRESVTYAEDDEPDDYVPVGQIDQLKLSLSSPPRWASTSAAVWPNVSGRPMVFLGQTGLPENEVTRTLLTWGTSLYLFWLRTDGSDQFKLVEQDVDRQSAEDHYAVEEERFI